MSYKKSRTKIEDLQQPAQIKAISSRSNDELISLSDEELEMTLGGRMAIFAVPCSCTQCNDVDCC